MDRREALVRIAWHEVKNLSRNQAEAIIRDFFKEPLKPSLRRKLNLTAVAQWETHTPPPNLHPGNPIYRPILVDRMKTRFAGATNEYLLRYLNKKVGMSVEYVAGYMPDLLACPVCRYKTFIELGTWQTCPVCGWNSDPLQEAIPTEAVGANNVSLVKAGKNYEMFGAITREKLADADPEGKEKYPRE